MSTQTVKICDVQGCRLVADHTLEYVTVANFNINQERMDNSDGLHIWTSIGVDMCGKHEHEYRSSLPQMKLKQMEGITNATRSNNGSN